MPGPLLVLSVQQQAALHAPILTTAGTIILSTLRVKPTKSNLIYITCDTFNVIYIIQCRLCNLQYIGETKRRLKDRFNEHRRPLLNPSGSYIQTAVSEHFLSNSHSVSHMLLIPIETLRYERDCLRKASEAHLIPKAETIEPLGMNKRDEL